MVFFCKIQLDLVFIFLDNMTSALPWSESQSKDSPSAVATDSTSDSIDRLSRWTSALNALQSVLNTMQEWCNDQVRRFIDSSIVRRLLISLLSFAYFLIVLCGDLGRSRMPSTSKFLLGSLDWWTNGRKIFRLKKHKIFTLLCGFLIGGISN